MRSHSLSAALAGQPLLDDAEFERLRLIALQYRSRHRAAGRGAGIHASRQRGPGMDLHDSRPYQPGDDVRHMDWRATARSARPVAKMFVAERRRDVRLFVDRRPAMMFGTRHELKAATAARVAALLAFQALAAQGAVGGLVFEDRAHPHPARGTLPGVLPLLRAAAAPPRRNPFRNPSLEQTHRTGNGLLPPDIAAPGATLYLISDFHDVIAGTAALADYLPADHARGGGIEVIAVRIVDDAEQRMRPAGTLRLVPPGGGAPVVVDTDDADLRRRYEVRAAQRAAAFAGECALHGVALLTITNCRDLHPQVEPLL